MSDLHRFQDGLDARGSDLGRWPARERARAEALLARAPEARAALRAAEAFDRMLAEAAPDAPKERLRRSILAALPAAGRVADSRRASGTGSWRLLWAGGFGAAASLAFSFYLGTAATDVVWPAVAATEATEAGTILDVDSLLFGFGFDGEST